MRKSLLSFIFAIATCSILVAQVPNHRICGTMENLQRLIQEDPAMAVRMQQIENQTAAYVTLHPQTAGNTIQSIVTIPVVFHVVYANASQNISDAQCQAQLNQLNLDFAKLNTDAGTVPAPFAAIAANTQIQFCMAVRDPSGNATTGIIHKSTTSSSFSTNDNIKHASTGGDDAWPAASYLNIWSGNLGGGLLGYAQFPGGTAATDGVVFLYSSIGSMLQPGTASPYNLGRTATHEIGHWLNLRHIWGDSNCGNDLVGDTPIQQTSNYGCPSYPHTTCSNGSSGDMFMNYMDYTDDGCMNMFSAGQTTRMQALFGTSGSRVSILSSMGCVPPIGCGVPVAQPTTVITTSSATINWTAIPGATYNILYQVSGSGSWIPATSSTNSLTLTGLTSTTLYEWEVQAVCTSGQSAFTAASTFTTATPVCGIPSGLTAGSITGTGTVLSWGSVPGAINYILQWKPTSATTWTTVSDLISTSYTLTGLNACTSYQFQVKDSCAYGKSAFSNSFSFTTTGCTITYCTSKGSSTSYEYINKVVLGTISNTSGNNNGYRDFTSFSTNIAGGGSNVITLSPGFSGSSYREYWNVWIDYNHNGSFADAGEKVATGNSTGSLSLSFIVPAGALNGVARMRIQMQYNSAPTSSCSSFTYGEVEDYTVNVVGNLQRSPAATLNLFAADVFLLYPNPARDEVAIAFNASTNEKAAIRIFDMLGKTILSEEVVAVESGKNDFRINLSETAKKKAAAKRSLS